MIQVTIGDAYKAAEWETVFVPSVTAFLLKRFKTFPANTRIYHQHVSIATDVTPHNPAEIAHLEALTGRFYVLTFPDGPIAIAVAIAVVLAATAIALTFIFRPNSAKPTDSSSPNNSAGDRQNESRPNERIPDIFGEVRSTPDVIQPPYKVFSGNEEVVYGRYCVGRGGYTISKSAATLNGTILAQYGALYDVKNDTTNLQMLDGSSALIYGPNSCPGDGSTPQLVIGQQFNEPMKNVIRNNAVVGQIMRAPNDQKVTSTNSIRANSNADSVECNDTNIDFTAYFGAGDTVVLNFDDASDPAGNIATVSLDGTYTVANVTSSVLTFVDPAAVNANWNQIKQMQSGYSNYSSPSITDNDPRWIGPYIVDLTGLTEIWVNVVAPNGLFKISASSGNQYQINDQYTVFIQLLDENYNPIGEGMTFTDTVYGSSVLQSQRGTTTKCVLPNRADGSPAGRVQVSMLRISPYDPTWQGTNADQIQWRDLYGVFPVDVPNFGDVTTIHTQDYATASALVTPQSKLNLEVTRNIPVRTAASPVIPDPQTLQPSKNAADIVCAIARDPLLGNRTDSEIDFAGIYAVLGPGGAVESYFGTSLVTQFCYTFDDLQTSFEEMLVDIGQATFCTFYRVGQVLCVFFEKQTPNSMLLFNHRNIIPNSQTRTVTFGLPSNYDSVQYDYIDPNAPNFPNVETTVTLFFPPDQSGIAPKKVKSVGVRNNVQANLLGWRLYQKMLYQNTTLQQKTTAEAALLINTQRMLVADNTRPDTNDGEVIDVNGLTLTLSQPFKGFANPTVFLTQTDGSVESIPITPDPTNEYSMILQSPPSLPLITDADYTSRTKFQIVGSNSAAATPFILTKKDSSDGWTYDVEGINYDDRYYLRDRDFITGALALNTQGTGSNAGWGSTVTTTAPGSAVTPGTVTPAPAPVAPDPVDPNRPQLEEDRTA